MTNSAVIFMAVVWSVIILATVYCFQKLLNSKRHFCSDDE